MYRDFIKPLLDRTICFIVLMFTWPVLAIIAVLIMCDSKGSALFKQKRLGKNGKGFTIYKFRTMVVGAREIGSRHITYEGDPRITPLGQILRKTSIDELPQLYNIIKGDMSIIGPRPLLQQDPAYGEYPDLFLKRYSVLPGLFCLVDIDYRAKASRELQFQLDAKYVDDMSLQTDAIILWKIFKVVLQRKNVYSSDKPTVSHDIDNKSL